MANRKILEALLSRLAGAPKRIDSPPTDPFESSLENAVSPRLQPTQEIQHEVNRIQTIGNRQRAFQERNDAIERTLLEQLLKDEMPF